MRKSTRHTRKPNNYSLSKEDERSKRGPPPPPRAPPKAPPQTPRTPQLPQTPPQTPQTSRTPQTPPPPKPSRSYKLLHRPNALTGHGSGREENRPRPAKPRPQHTMPHLVPKIFCVDDLRIGKTGTTIVVKARSDSVEFFLKHYDFWKNPNAKIALQVATVLKVKS